MKEPNSNLWKVIGGLLVSIGLILFLFTLHLIVINTSGFSESAVLTMFEISLKIFIFLAFTAFTFILIWTFKVLIYIATTPKWLRNERAEAKGK